MAIIQNTLFSVAEIQNTMSSVAVIQNTLFSVAEIQNTMSSVAVIQAKTQFQEEKDF